MKKILNEILYWIIIIESIVMSIMIIITEDKQLALIYGSVSVGSLILLLLSFIINKNNKFDEIKNHISVSTLMILHSNIGLLRKLDFVLEKLYENDKECYENVKKEFDKFTSDNKKYLNESIKNIKN